MNNLHIVNILNHAIKFILLFFILLSLHVSDVIAAGSEITVNVPKPVAGTYLSQIIVSVTVNSDEDIQFRIVNPDYPGTSELLLPYTGVTADSFHIYPNADVVAVSEKATGSPKVFRYEINISPNSNADTLCGDRRASGDNWVIEAIVKPGGSGVVDITSACVNSYDRSSGCTSGNIFINSSDPASVAHILTGGSP
ncbi:MAG TPA: hypothetical protein ENJ08_01985, partial [Gammaproteobacteria bacterium]|nr:hypothetical protein [Gammaproteobacteria bacterium]